MINTSKCYEIMKLVILSLHKSNKRLEFHYMLLIATIKTLKSVLIAKKLSFKKGLDEVL
jgi:hypothetical protein